MYAFCISPEKSLEHLYWGEALTKGYDLRYLGQSFRMTHFNTYEMPLADGHGSPSTASGLGVGSRIKAGTVGELAESWRGFKVRSMRLIPSAPRVRH
jgi:hypothetical protein